MAQITEITNLPVLSEDIYKINEFVDSIKQKYVDISEDTLALGLFGYMGTVFSNLIENTTIMASEYSNEAIPTKAKFERNVIAHALALGINKIWAEPATISVLLCIQEQALINNMVDNKFVLDKEYIFYVGEDQSYPYTIDYDIIIRRDKLPNGSWVYSARYDIDGKNDKAELINPYLPSVGLMNVEGDTMVSLKTTLRQMVHTQIYKKILSNNVLENKIINFSFEDQLAFFYIEVLEDGVVHYLKPIYDGLYDYEDNTEYINYMYLDEKNIRLCFNKDSYFPRQNAEVTVHIYTTLGSQCNFTTNRYQVAKALTTNRFTYNNMWILLMTESDSQYGADRLSIKQLKTAIPREAITLKHVTTYTDLENIFNAIQTEDCKLYFLEKVHNQLERLFFCYLLMKDGSNIIPTNTINPRITRGMFDSSNKNSFTIKPGSVYYFDPDAEDIYGLVAPTTNEIDEFDKKTFLYMNPYLIVVNKSPFYVAYYLTIFNYRRTLYFDYINEDSMLQFVTLDFNVKREYFTDPDTIVVSLAAMQTINTDFQLITYSQSGGVEDVKLALFLVLYTTNDDGEEVPVRYCKGEFVDLNESDYMFTYEFRFSTNDQISALGTYMTITNGLYNVSDGVMASYAVSPNMKAKFFYLAKLDTIPSKGRVYGENEQENLDDIIPGLDDYTLTNIYSAGDEGIDIFFDYSDIQYSFIEIEPVDNDLQYRIHKLPVVRYSYMNTEERIQSFLNQVDRRRRYIQYVLPFLENSFGIDYKFFNTYGPSKMYNIDETENVDRINLSLIFEIKFQIPTERSYIPAITNSIKEYIEDMNYITDLHMPNLITYITNLYREQLVYIKFIRLNDYGSLHQSIYKNPKIDKNYFVETQTVPEFINVNTLNNGYADIQFRIKE